jgi:hypothetical protein
MADTINSSFSSPTPEQLARLGNALEETGNLLDSQDGGGTVVFDEGLPLVHQRTSIIALSFL